MTAKFCAFAGFKPRISSWNHEKYYLKPFTKTVHIIQAHWFIQSFRQQIKMTAKTERYIGLAFACIAERLLKLSCSRGRVGEISRIWTWQRSGTACRFPILSYDLHDRIYADFYNLRKLVKKENKKERKSLFTPIFRNSVLTRRVETVYNKRVVVTLWNIVIGSPCFNYSYNHN